MFLKVHVFECCCLELVVGRDSQGLPHRCARERGVQSHCRCQDMRPLAPITTALCSSLPASHVPFSRLFVPSPKRVPFKGVPKKDQSVFGQKKTKREAAEGTPPPESPRSRSNRGDSPVPWRPNSGDRTKARGVVYRETQPRCEVTCETHKGPIPGTWRPTTSFWAPLVVDGDKCGRQSFPWGGRGDARGNVSGFNVPG
jgi:hypothetical protein